MGKLIVLLSVLTLAGCPIEPTIKHKAERVEVEPIEVLPIKVDINATVEPMEPMQVTVNVKIDPVHFSAELVDLKTWQIDGVTYVGKFAGSLMLECEPLDPFAQYPATPTDVSDLDAYRTTPKTIDERKNCLTS